MNYLGLILFFVIGVSMGNYAGDQKTAVDCASKGEAKLMGGATVICELKKDEK
jgi:hypothetical protein